MLLVFSNAPQMLVTYYGSLALVLPMQLVGRARDIVVYLNGSGTPLILSSMR